MLPNGAINAQSGAGHVGSMGSVLQCLSSKRKQLKTPLCQRAMANVESEWIELLLTDADATTNAAELSGKGEDSPFHVDPAVAMTLRHVCADDGRLLCNARDGSSTSLSVDALQGTSQEGRGWGGGVGGGGA